MPSPDESYYNIKRLHVVFAISSVALLAVTVWMLAADHWREWKVHQRTFRDRVEPWATEARIREARNEEFQAVEETLIKALQQARAAVPDRELIEQFVDELGREAGSEGAGGAADIEAAYESLVYARFRHQYGA